MTPVKIQNPWQSCWAFAGTAAAETSILSMLQEKGQAADAKSFDLSEKHLTWFAVQPVIEQVDQTQVGEGIYAIGQEGDPTAPYDNGGMPLYITTLFSAGVGPVAIDLEWMNRAGAGQRYFFSDFTVISKIIWTVGKWNICAKGGYEENPWENVDAQGRPLDLAVAPGTRNIYAGCGVEFFPLPDRDKLRLHAVYFRSSSIGIDNFDIGVTWRLDIIKR